MHTVHIKCYLKVFTMQNKIKSLINDGLQTNAIFQDFYTNLMRLSHDESHLSKGNMSSQKSTFNRFNGLLDRYLENMIRKPCFVRRTSKSTSYGLASTNTKAVQLLEKTIVENEITKNTYQTNMVEHVQEINFMKHSYTPTLKYSFVISEILILIIHSS